MSGGIGMDGSGGLHSAGSDRRARVQGYPLDQCHGLRLEMSRHSEPTSACSHTEFEAVRESIAPALKGLAPHALVRRCWGHADRPEGTAPCTSGDSSTWQPDYSNILGRHGEPALGRFQRIARNTVPGKLTV